MEFAAWCVPNWVSINSAMKLLIHLEYLPTCNSPPELEKCLLYKTEKISISHSSNREVEFLPLQNPNKDISPSISFPSPNWNQYSLSIINPKEIRIQHGLHQPRHPSYLIHIPLCKIPIQPIWNIQRPI